ncbi:S8 family peptidase [Scatolibacter rhodanostii]|uniref:S8 family peptidase n=1 Tax=Scatolibacter rhodanostii TaxID=2014781 RepID=UPI000C08CBCA|nr:S8 family peptidase [Scatolibacter rhodanostii]
MNNKHPILGRGELYISDIDKRYYGGPPKLPHSYHENKITLINSISSIQEEIKHNDEIFLSEKVICMRMEPKFEAKSYSPDMLLSIDGITPIGGRKYTISKSEEGQVKSKLYFAKTNDDGLENLKHVLQSGQKDSVVTWQNQICTIRTIDLLAPNEKLSGFSSTWDSGLVEIVLHPFFWDDNFAMEQFLSILNLDKDKYKMTGYHNGPLFCAAECTQETINKLLMFNPLRTIHPLGELNIPNMRGKDFFDAPVPPIYKGKPQITIGIFDGGADETLPHLKDFITVHNLTSVNSHPSLIAHGTAVCGASLYGVLNYKKSSEQLDTPIVSVESYRILPQKQTGNPLEDNGLYPAIDEIEKVVTQRADIKLYNLSFGPRGAIIDDDISRFTYALDILSTLPHHPLFCVAVGNDGDLPYPFNRVQAPADLVNGLGIGAYTFDRTGDKVRANYSCIGPGREGCKVKPDILEFGGSPENPAILISTTANKTITECGTSFSSPIVAGKLGKIMALSPEISPQMARTLLIHTAEDSEELGIEEIGFGFCTENIQDILNCEDNKVIVLYEGNIVPKQNIKLPILLPNLNGIKCNANITWTISTLAELNPNDVDSYTCNCIEDYFYPHDNHFNYFKNTINGRRQKAAFAGSGEEQELIDLGYNRSDLPISKPPKKFLSEDELRSQHLKWDTIVKKTLNMRVSSLHNPFFILHGMNRDIFNTETMKYFVAITIDIPKYSGILYDDILTQYRGLVPINIQTENQLFVKV